MSGFASWSAGAWITFGFGVTLLAGGLLMALFGPARARRQAERDGRVDADGDPWYEDNNGPRTLVRGGLITAAIGLAYTIWKLASGGVL